MLGMVFPSVGSNYARKLSLHCVVSTRTNPLHINDMYSLSIIRTQYDRLMIDMEMKSNKTHRHI